LDTILTGAYGMDEAEFSTFAKSRGSMEDIKKLLQLTGDDHVACNYLIELRFVICDFWNSRQPERKTRDDGHAFESPGLSHVHGQGEDESHH